MSQLKDSDFNRDWSDEALVEAGKILSLGASLCRDDLEAAMCTGRVAHDLDDRIAALEADAAQDAARHAADIAEEDARRKAVEDALARYNRALAACRECGEARLDYAREIELALPGLETERIAALRAKAEAGAARDAEADACYQLLRDARAALNEKMLSNAKIYSKAGGARDDWRHAHKYVLNEIEKLKGLRDRVQGTAAAGITPAYIDAVADYFVARESILPLTGKIIRVAKSVVGDDFLQHDGEFSDLDRAQLLEGAFDEVARKLKIFRPLSSIADKRGAPAVLDVAALAPHEFVRVFDSYIAMMMGWGIRAALLRIKAARQLFTAAEDMTFGDEDDPNRPHAIERFADPRPFAPPRADTLPDDAEMGARLRAGAIAGIDEEDIIEDMLAGVRAAMPGDNIIRQISAEHTRLLLREMLTRAIAGFDAANTRAERETRLLDIVDGCGCRQKVILARIIGAAAQYLIGTQLWKVGTPDETCLARIEAECAKFLATIRNPYRVWH